MISIDSHIKKSLNGLIPDICCLQIYGCVLVSGEILAGFLIAYALCPLAHIVLLLKEELCKKRITLLIAKIHHLQPTVWHDSESHWQSEKHFSFGKNPRAEQPKRIG